MLVLGVTGGIASGKSTVARYLNTEKGVPVIDADKLGHQCYNIGTHAYKGVVETFGDKVVAADGSIDRKALGTIVFGSTSEMKKLTDIVWPEIVKLLREALQDFSDKG